jgi:hypothetical protein
MRFSINLNWVLTVLLSFTVITLITFMLVGYICFKFLKFHYISSNNSISDYDTMAKDILEKYGDDPIQSITIVKKKLTLPTIFLIMVAELPNFSPSNFSNLLKMYHTGLILHVKSQNKFDQHIYIEKGNKVSISQNYSISQHDKVMTIFIDNDEKPTLNGMLETTKEKMGPLNFFNWNNFYKNNCQTFIVNMLECNKLLDLTSKKFIKDDFEIHFNDFTQYLFNQAIYIYSLINNQLLTNS